MLILLSPRKRKASQIGGHSPAIRKHASAPVEKHVSGEDDANVELHEEIWNDLCCPQQPKRRKRLRVRRRTSSTKKLSALSTTTDLAASISPSRKRGLSCEQIELNDHKLCAADQDSLEKLVNMGFSKTQVEEVLVNNDDFDAAYSLLLDISQTNNDDRLPAETQSIPGESNISRTEIDLCNASDEDNPCFTTKKHQPLNLGHHDGGQTSNSGHSFSFNFVPISNLRNTSIDFLNQFENTLNRPSEKPGKGKRKYQWKSKNRRGYKLSRRHYKRRKR